MLDVLGVISRWVIPLFITAVLVTAVLRRIPVFEMFVEGSQQGFEIAVKLIPFLVAMIMAISIFRASGAMDIMVAVVSPFFNLIGAPAEVLPHAVMRPLSGGAALGIASELIDVHGPDSFIGTLVSTMQGTSDTTFYVLTLYFGSVGVRKYRYSIASGLTADLTTLFASIFIVSLIYAGAR